MENALTSVLVERKRFERIDGVVTKTAFDDDDEDFGS